MSGIPITTTENATSPFIGACPTGTVITVTTNEPDVPKILAAGFDRLLLERSTDGGLSFSEVTVPSSRPVLAADTSTYEVRDVAGNELYQYRFRYINTSTGALSGASEAIAGAGLAIRNLLTVAELKERYFFGIDITNDAGEPLPDSTFEHYILQAIRWFEHQIDIPILPTTFSEAHDYYRADYNRFQFIPLDNYPVISVSEFRVQYPSGQNVVVYPEEWFRLNREEGHLQIVPTAGTLTELLVGSGGSFLPSIYNGQDYLPQLFQIDYTAGFEDGKVPRNIVDLIGMFAALGPFHIFGDLIAGAGIATVSLSMDGLSQNIGTTSSATNSGYGSRVLNYLKQIKEQIPMLRRYYKRIRMVSA